MPRTPDHLNSHPTADRRPDPFASLAVSPVRRQRFWLVDLFIRPFLDHDERATYHSVGKEAEAKRAAGLRSGKAWRGNGTPSDARL